MYDRKPNTAIEPREIRKATLSDDDAKALGPLHHLPGTWANVRLEHRLTKPDGEVDSFQSECTLRGKGASEFDGRGWNLIALPFINDQGAPYRILMNQYNEVLKFDHIDDNVPNRGIIENQQADQKVAALDYVQQIAQIASADNPASSAQIRGADLAAIHHEPGFFLHMKEQTIEGFNVARLATIPHGNAATAIGKAGEPTKGKPKIPALSSFPEGAIPIPDGEDPEQFVADAVKKAEPGSYLFPYRFFLDNPFKGVLACNADFPGFNTENSNNLLNFLPDDIVSTTELPLNTDAREAGIRNIPFIEQEADASLMRSTFWIMQRSSLDKMGNPKLLLAYSQFISLDFFQRRDGVEGKIRWPHISINVMEKILDPEGREL
jgi:hypothetical protein